MSVLNKSFLHKLKNNIIFFIIYSLLFLVVIKTFGYIAPFFIGGLLAFIINPLSQKLERKFKINKGISTLFLSILGVALVIFIASILVVKGSHQLVEFLNDIDSNSYSYFGTMVNDWIDNLSKYMDYIQGISNNSINVQDLVSRYGNNLANIAKSMLTKTIDLATSLPTLILIIITLFMSTYFIAKDFDKIGYGFLNIFTDETKIKVRRVKSEIVYSVKGYIKPFLGIVVIFVPVIIYYFIIENYFVSIGISIVFIALSIIRQILEPRLVAANVGISPLSTIIAIFVGIQVAGMLGIIFCLGLLVMHDILKKVDIL